MGLTSLPGRIYYDESQHSKMYRLASA